MAILQLKPSWEILNRPHDIKSQKLTYLVTMVLHLPLLFTMFLGRCFLIKHTCKKLEALNMFATLKIPRLGNLEGEWLIVHSPQGGFNLWDQWHFTLVLRLQICCWCDSPDKVVGSWMLAEATWSSDSTHSVTPKHPCTGKSSHFMPETVQEHHKTS